MKTIISTLQALVLLAAALVAACSEGPSVKPPAVSCKLDSECDTGHCDPKSGCVACVFDSHCKDGERCADGACYAPKGCSKDADCADSDFPICDPNQRECVRCLTDEQCGDSARCQNGSCQAFERCAKEQDCAGKGHCDLGSGECVACLTRGDCTVGSDCVAGQCQLLCKAEADCTASGQHCTEGHCGECATDQHCPEIYNCQAGRCQRDACAQGTSSCDEAGRSVETCSSNGNSLVVSQCAAGQSCVAGALVATCQPWVCAPGATRCSADGSSLQHCAADGLSVASDEPCADGERCVAGACVTISCEPHAAFCQDGASYVCSFDGTSSTLVRACDGSELCDTGTGKCVLKRCAPGATSCSGNNVGTCDADGATVTYEPCGAEQVCTDGACQDVICSPGTTYCSGKDRLVCNATGTSASKYETCQMDCVANGNSAYCSSVTCTPGAALCDLGAATVCKADGSGPEPGGVDCASVDGYCDVATGSCKPMLCEPNARSCQGEYMYQCSSDGMYSSLYSYYACTDWYWGYSKCNPQTGMCQQPVCTPSSTYCNGTQVTTCDATGYEKTVGEDCAASNELCLNGACVAKVCEPSTYSCKDGNVQRCYDGTSLSLYDTCTAKEYCSEGVYYCQQDVCTAGASICNGNAVTTCKSDGSGPTGAGTACTGGKVCVDGACKATSCTANTLTCLNGHVHQCNSTGTAATLYQYCVSEAYCDAASNSCKPDACPSGKPYCDAETYKTCKADGSGAVDAGTVCSTTSKVCTLSGCAATALDVQGDVGATYNLFGVADYFFGNVIKVSQNRKLTKIEADLAITGGPVSAHWLVFSSTDGVTFYQASDTAANLANTADAWIGSAALDVELQAGLYYLIGVELAPASGGTVTYHRNDKVSTPSISFAQVLGSSTKALAGPPASLAPPRNANLYYLRFSTTLP